ncbi:substrate-binding domain-containing protein [Actinoplanes hulinensis]|uniref:Substrate-binding domain-containing protein n=1 Tax=Actinoplanes hulinensis TaxID=1144547 RepID=A0ABS7AZD9_9ACTN|nr:substrate-binding domain-containing protein [Actinoplanes hulinensis]MBW6434132.1 substrate-binding domain-containing protein [Actinoplanes hulinensis]
MSDNEWPRELPPPHHGDWGDEPPQARSRMLLSAGLVIVVLLAAGGVAWQLMRNGSAQPATQASAAPLPSSTQPSVTPCPDPELTVAAAPEIEPVIRAAAVTLNPPGQRCAPILVRAEEPGVTLAAVDQPDVWVPSSSAWLRIAEENKLAFRTSGATLAYSPIMLTAPEAIGSLYIKDGKTTWNELIEGVASERIPVATMSDPLTTTTGLLSVHGVHAATALAARDPGIAQLRALTLRSRLTDAAADPGSLLGRMAAQSDTTSAVYDIGVFPAIEQQLLAYQKGGHRVALTGAAPSDGMVEADYPYAIRKGAKTGLADRLRAAITKQALTEAGFRAEPTAGGARLPGTGKALLDPARQWAGFQSLAFQVLLLIDASGSMNEKIGGGPATKASLLRESGASAAQLFNRDTTIGMWYFGAGAANSPAHTEEVSFGPINGDAGGKKRRDALTEKIKTYRPQSNAGTPLYQTVLDGVAAMREEVKSGRPSVVVVLTDGADGGTRFAMSQQEFQKRLAAGRDPARPVPVIAVGYGPDANMPALQSMAKATGGQAIAAKNPADLASAMAKAFLAARAAN